MEDYHKTVVNDLESTGLVPQTEVPGKRPGTTKKEQIPYETGCNDYPYIVSIAWKVDDNETVEYIINQEGREIPQESIDIHGITDEIASKSDFNLSDAILEMIEDCKDAEIVVGHGIYFNTSIIKANILREIDLDRLTKEDYNAMVEILDKDKRIDTMRSTAKMMRKWPTLTELHQKIFHRGFDAHSAREDVEANYRCYKWLLGKKIVPTWDKLQKKKEEREKVAA